MAPMIIGLPARLPFRDLRLMSGKREPWLKLGGREETKWKGGSLLLYWEVRMDGPATNEYGLPSPRAVYVVEHTTGGGSGAKLFTTLVEADQCFDQLERENMIEIAMSALGIEP